MIKIESYKDINGIAFGSNVSVATSVFGEPISKTKDRTGETELHYAGLILRFTPGNGELREATLLPECMATINGTPVVWEKSFLDWMASEDSGLMELHGYVLSMKLGIVVTGFHDDDVSQRAVHAFRKGEWDKRCTRMRPFKW